MGTNRQVGRVLLDVAILLIAAHSLVLGVSLLSFPMWVLKVAGWEYSGEVFWPSQAGLFLIILGGAYAAAVRFRPLVWLLVISKGCAVVFLVAHALWLDAPRLVLLLGVADGSMGLVTTLLYLYTRPAIHGSR